MDEPRSFDAITKDLVYNLLVAEKKIDEGQYGSAMAYLAGAIMNLSEKLDVMWAELTAGD